MFSQVQNSNKIESSFKIIYSNLTIFTSILTSFPISDAKTESMRELFSWKATILKKEKNKKL